MEPGDSAESASVHATHGSASQFDPRQIEPAAAAAVAASVPTGATEFVIDDSFDLSVSPVKKDDEMEAHPRARRRVIPQGPPRSRAGSVSMPPGRKRPTGVEAPTPRQRQATPRASPWPDAQSSVHAQVRIGADGWTTIKLAEQLDADRQHIKMLQDTIETMCAVADALFFFYPSHFSTF